MAELIEIPYKQIPQILCHYTKPENFKSIVSGEGGKDKEICFWAYSNLCKNDTHELEYGKRIYDNVKSWLKSQKKEDYLYSILDEKKSFSLSFTEGANPLEMIKSYGTIRLEFNLKDVFSNQDLMPCEYCEETEIDEYSKLFIDEFKSLFTEQESFKYSARKKDSDLIQLVKKGNGLKSSLREKVFFVKGKKDWEGEDEWRIIFLSPQKRSPFRLNKIKTTYIKVYLPIECLTSVHLFNADSINTSLSSYQFKDNFEKHISIHNWSIPIIIDDL